MPTSNPVPSQDPSDLLFNAGKLDEVVNGTANSFTDRLGVARRTVAGMNADFDAQLADAESDLNVYRADAAASAAEALGYLQTIRATSYGAYAEDPATDPLGNPPTVGDEYFNTTANLLKRWNGTTWQASDINTANLAAPSGSSLIGYMPAGIGAVATTVQDQLRRESVQAVNHGADPTGVSDSTDAIVKALETGKDVKLTDGTYRLSPTAVQTISNQGYQRLYGEGNVTLSVNLTSSIDLFAFNGPVALENLTIDFNNSYARYAFKWNSNAGHIRIKNIRLRNLKDIDSSTGSITFLINPTGNTFEIKGIKAYSMLKRGNGVITDAAGSYNMIYVGGGVGSTQGSIRDIFSHEVHNINSSDQVIYEDTAAIYVITDANDSQNRIEISNVHGYNFGKRLLKIHASNVTADNITGYSTDGDSLGVIGFMTGEGMGDKYGCSASNVRAYGLMEYAFSSSADNVKWRNVVSSVQPGNKVGMSNGAFGFLVNGDGTDIDGFWSDSQRDIAIGVASKIIKNTKLRNIHLVLDNKKVATIHNLSATIGFDGLFIDGLSATVDADATTSAVIMLHDYLDGITKKGRNLVVNNVNVKSNGPLNSYCIITKYVDNVSVHVCKYINTSGLSHFRIVSIENGSNVNVDDVVIEGTNQIGVFVKDCTGRTTIGRVYNPGATIGAVYNNNSADVWVYGCDHAKVGGATTATPQNSKHTVGTTAQRPTTGLVAGYSQHFDTTLGKPIWWNGSVWKDATGTTV